MDVSKITSLLEKAAGTDNLNESHAFLKKASELLSAGGHSFRDLSINLFDIDAIDDKPFELQTSSSLQDQLAAMQRETMELRGKALTLGADLERAKREIRVLKANGKGKPKTSEDGSITFGELTLYAQVQFKTLKSWKRLMAQQVGFEEGLMQNWAKKDRVPPEFVKRIYATDLRPETGKDAPKRTAFTDDELDQLTDLLEQGHTIDSAAKVLSERLGRLVTQGSAKSAGQRWKTMQEIKRLHDQGITAPLYILNHLKMTFAKDHKGVSAVNVKKVLDSLATNSRR